MLDYFVNYELRDQTILFTKQLIDYISPTSINNCIYFLIQNEQETHSQIVKIPLIDCSKPQITSIEIKRTSKGPSVPFKMIMDQNTETILLFYEDNYLKIIQSINFLNSDKNEWNSTIGFSFKNIFLMGNFNNNYFFIYQNETGLYSTKEFNFKNIPAGISGDLILSENYDKVFYSEQESDIYFINVSPGSILVAIYDFTTSKLCKKLFFKLDVILVERIETYLIF